MIFELLVAGAFALATLRRYSVAQTITFTSLAFFLSSGLNTVSGAPAFGLRTIESSSNNTYRWLQPCGNPMPMQLKRMPQRHSVHRTLKRVRIQLRIAQNHFKMHLKDIHEIYSKVYKVLKEQYRMPWLPEKEFDWYYREIWCLEKGKKAGRALPHLHDSLQRFAITFHHLRDFYLKSDINVDLTMNRRNEIINQMHNEILRVLCEVETAILNLDLNIPTKHKSKIVTESSNWAKEGDLTLMLIQDWGVIRFYQTFLNAWTKAFRNATAPGLGTCDPKKQKYPGPKIINRGPGQKGKRISKIKKQNKPVRKHSLGAGQNSSLSRGPRKGSSKHSLFRNKQRKLAEV
ncbi:uncharacterized protein LOC128878828 isoform X1 [Hylaeus volcanicus]|uniref:uncharacterized protein LOC128878828 isoform X1 n=1 Tax=Hylaeus volcanicus TaxID=313075 RepID=UPI0023B7BB8F|nr:uncharacterized protein LOC128878828 isoform X1 [Hylaeus volcanicus]